METLTLYDMLKPIEKGIFLSPVLIFLGYVEIRKFGPLPCDWEFVYEL